jgi:hypothetical protein
MTHMDGADAGRFTVHACNCSSVAVTPPHTTTSTELNASSAGNRSYTAASAAPQAGSTTTRWSSANCKQADTAALSDTTAL